MARSPGCTAVLGALALACGGPAPGSVEDSGAPDVGDADAAPPAGGFSLRVLSLAVGAPALRACLYATDEPFAALLPPARAAPEGLRLFDASGYVTVPAIVSSVRFYRDEDLRAGSAADCGEALARVTPWAEDRLPHDVVELHSWATAYLVGVGSASTEPPPVCGASFDEPCSADALALEVVAAKDDRAASSTATRVRVLHAVPNLPGALEVCWAPPGGGIPLSLGVAGAYGEASRYVARAAMGDGSLSVHRVARDGDAGAAPGGCDAARSLPGTVTLPLAPSDVGHGGLRSLPAGSNVTLVAHGLAGAGGGLSLRPYADGPGAP